MAWKDRLGKVDLKIFDRDHGERLLEMWRQVEVEQGRRDRGSQDAKTEGDDVEV